MATVRSNLCMVVSNDGKDYSLNFGGSLVTIFHEGDNVTIPYAHLDALISALREGRLFMEVDYNAPKVEQGQPSSPEPGILIQTSGNGPFDLAPSIDPNHHDDPAWVYLARHEYKDLYFSAKDMMEDARSYTGDRASAHPFPTRYAALRFTQGVKHPVTILAAPAAHVVSWRVTENDVRHFYRADNDSGTLHVSKADKLTIDHASKIAQSLPSSFIISVDKVAF